MHPHLAVYFGSPFGRYPTFHTLTSVGQKGFQYAKRMFPLFRAIVKYMITYINDTSILSSTELVLMDLSGGLV